MLCCAALQVTNENKREYVDLVAEHRMTTAIRAQTQSFLKGFWEMVPKVSGAALKHACASAEAARLPCSSQPATSALLLQLSSVLLRAFPQQVHATEKGMSLALSGEESIDRRDQCNKYTFFYAQLVKCSISGQQSFFIDHNVRTCCEGWVSGLRFPDRRSRSGIQPLTVHDRPEPGLRGSWRLQDLISIFNDAELELLVCGLPEIDTDDLRANTEYTGYTPSSPVVQYFWEVRRQPAWPCFGIGTPCAGIGASTDCLSPCTHALDFMRSDEVA